MERAITAKEDGQLAFLEVELGNAKMATAQAEENVKVSSSSFPTLPNSTELTFLSSDCCAFAGSIK